MDEIIKAQISGWLIGNSCTTAESPNGIPFLSFGSFGLWIPSPWRIIVENQILASGDLDAKTLGEELATVMSGQTPQTIHISGPLHDLSIQFESLIRLEIFSDSAIHENWHISGGPDKMVIAGPGSSWSAF